MFIWKILSIVWYIITIYLLFTLINPWIIVYILICVCNLLLLCHVDFENRVDFIEVENKNEG